MTTTTNGWCQCGYRYNAHDSERCPIQPPDGVTILKFKPNTGSDAAEAMHERARAHRAAGEQVGLEL